MSSTPPPPKVFRCSMQRGAMNMPVTTITLHHDHLHFKWLLQGHRSLPKAQIRSIEPYHGLFSLAMVFGRAFRIVHTSPNFPNSLVVAQINAHRFREALAAADYPVAHGR